MRGLGVLLGYTGVVFLLTWPLGAHLTTHLPHTAIGCSFDSLFSAWVLSHLSRTLVHPCTSCLVNANIYHPSPRALFYGPVCLSALPVYAPPFLITGNPTFALNLLLLGGIAATATTLHLVVRRWTGSHAAGFVAAWALLTTRWVLWDWIPATPYWAVLWYFPPIIFLATHRSTGLRMGIILTALVTLQSLTDPVYVAPAVLGPLAVIALLRLARPETRAAGRHLLLCLTVATGLVGATQAGQLALMHKENLNGQTMWWFAVQPAELPADLLKPLSAAALPLTAWVFAAIAVARAAHLWRSADPAAVAHRHALWWAAAGLLISITPVVKLFGHTLPIPPLQWLNRVVAIHKRLRNPIRLRVASLFGLTILAGLGFDTAARWLASRCGIPRRTASAVMTVLVGAGMFVEYRMGLPPLKPSLPDAYPIAEAITPSPTLLPLLRAPGGPLLELPLKVEVSVWPTPHARAMYHSIFHGRRLLNGYSSYYPAGFRERMDLACRLPDSEALAALERETGLELVLVHSGEVAGEARERWLAIAEGGDDSRLRLVARDHDDLLFRVAPAP